VNPEDAAIPTPCEAVSQKHLFFKEHNYLLSERKMVAKKMGGI